MSVLSIIYIVSRSKLGKKVKISNMFTLKKITKKKLERKMIRDLQRKEEKIKKNEDENKGGGAFKKQRLIAIKALCKF